MHQLDRHLAFEHGVERTVDGAHTAVPDLLVEAVATAECGAKDGAVHDLSLECLSMPTLASGSASCLFFWD